MQSPSKFVFLITVCASLGGILYGYDIGVVSGALLFIQQSIPMSEQQEGIMVGAVMMGSLVGTLLTGTLTDHLGRRRMIIVACYTFLIGIVVIQMAETFAVLLLARLLLGVAVGMVAVSVPLYLVEVTPASLRGRSVTVFQLFLTFGILLAYFVDMLFTPWGNWRGMFVVIVIPAVVLLFGMLSLPESPRWLVAKGYFTRAKRVLSQTHPMDKVEEEFKIISEGLHYSRGSWRDLFSLKNMWPLFLALFVSISNQLTGINAILQYAPVVIKSSGNITNMSTMVGTVSMGVVNLIGTIFALFLIDEIGRKRLLMMGTGGILLACIFLSIVASFPPSSLTALFSVFGLLIYIVGFAIGPGVVVWLIISELFPTRIRGKGIALCLFANSAAGALVSSIFLEIFHGVGLRGSYLLFGAFTFLYFLMAMFLLPETRGQNLEAITSYEKVDKTAESVISVLPS
jgi:SP family galactose:H+ symporter-like MFS transporter